MSAKTSAPAPIPTSQGGSIVTPSYALPPATGSGSGASSSGGVGGASSSATGGGGAGASSLSRTGLVTAHARDTSLPPTRQVDAAALDYLTIEMVQTLTASAGVAARKLARHREQLKEAGFFVPPLPPAASSSGGGSGSNRGSQQLGASASQQPLESEPVHRSVSQAQAVSAPGTLAAAKRLSLGATAGAGASSPTQEEIDVELAARLEVIGYHVGANMAERLSSLRPPYATILDVLKFVCKEVWTALWEKQVDNLRTNHRGVYVLQDNNFKPLRRMSTARGLEATTREARPHLAYSCGIVRGALTRMGVTCTVSVDILAPPAAGAAAGAAGGGAAAAGTAGAGPGAALPPAHATACTFSVKTASGR